MNKPYVMGIDIGGGSVRCLLVNSTNGVSHTAARSWFFPVAEGSFGLGFDLNLDEMWRLIGEASRETVARADITPDQISAVAVSAMRFGTVIIDKNGKSLYAVPNRDARAAGECFELAAECGEELNQETGLWPLPIHLSARLKMLKKNQPDVISQADCILSMGDWVNYKLCGTKATDYSQAGVTQLFNLKTRQWNKTRIEKLGIPLAIFPEVNNSGTKLGVVSAEAAAHLGLAAGAVVGLGGGDTQCSLLGAGVIKTGDIASVAGTTAPVMVVCDNPVIDREARTWSGHHVMPGLYVVESSGGPMGETLTWMARLLFPDVPEPELRVFAEAALSEYGAKGMLSSLGAEVMNSRAPSMPAGQITLTHMSCPSDPNPRRHLCRALIEGYASAVRANIEQLSEVTGSKYQDVFLTAGFSRSNVFAQILADINSSHVIAAGEANTSAMGAAICAATAAGKYKDLVQAVSVLVKNRDAVACNAGKSAAAQKVYADWIAMRNAGKDTTAVQVGNHVLHYVFGASDESSKKEKQINIELKALVTAAFDDASLNKMRTKMEVEYANFRETKRILTGPGMVQAMQGRQILVTEVDIVDAKAISQLPDLRVVAACRGNAVNVDVDACTAFGIPVLFAPGRNSVAVADLTIAFILALARKLVPASQFLKDESVTAGNMAKMGQAFTQLQGKELWHKTVGLVGLGAVGRMVAKRLQGFDTRIIAADPFATPEAAALAGVELVSFDTLLREADFVSLHAAVTPSTANMIGRNEFAKMKPGAYFINTARAQLVDEPALIEALQGDRLAGAALDTFLQEPPGFDHPLIKNPKVLSAPHSAGNTFEVAQHQGADVSAALLQLISGEKPRACLNPEVLKDFNWEKSRKQPSPVEVEALLKKPAPGVTDLQRDENAGISHGATQGGKADEKKDIAAATASPQIIENMRKIFEKFCSAMSQDTAVKKFSEDQDVTLSFNAPDIGMQFFIGLNKGVVTAGLGEKHGDVQLAMRAFILDGMFNGTTDAMNAAMNGEISFMGDAAKAMTIQHLQADMERLYKAIRIEVGDPGDLASIPKAGGIVSAASIAHAGERDVRHELLDIVNELYDHYIITATGGNVSVRCPDNPDECWITPSSVFKGDLRAEMMVRLTLDGKKIDPMSRSPSSEWGFHTQTLKKKPKANAVIHAHAPNATILANCGIPFLPISSDAAFFGDIKRIPFTMPGSDDLAELVSEALKDDWAVFMENHGIVVAGKSLRRACDMAQIIERTAEVILGCYQATGGKPPKLLPKEAVDLFRSMGDIVA